VATKAISQTPRKPEPTFWACQYSFFQFNDDLGEEVQIWVIDPNHIYSNEVEALKAANALNLDPDPDGHWYAVRGIQVHPDVETVRRAVEGMVEGL
jgi:hypothetical protein